MKTIWVQHLKDPQERAKFKQTLKNSRTAIDKLREIVYNSTKEQKEADYDCPSWSHKQAHLNGYNEAIQSFLEVLDLKDE
ncbi:MAG: hypothetical protein KUG81_07195 [Gammaproteobacteria bacterium]|nr:hypothetical protein [Gammaproteobacteria bacterium]